MERVAKKEIYKEGERGGWGVLEVEVFVYGHVVAGMVREVLRGKGYAGKFGRYSGGRLWRTLGCLGTDGRGCGQGNCLHYGRVGSFIRDKELGGLGREGLQNARAMLKMIRGKDGLTDVRELLWGQVQQVWKGVIDKRWEPGHRELGWRVARRVLMVRETQYRWGLVR